MFGAASDARAAPAPGSQRQRPSDAAPSAPRRSPRASGSELFIQRDAEVVIGGAPFRYARSYAAAASYAERRDRHRDRAPTPIIIFNAAPKNEHEVARLLSIDTTGGGGADAARSLDAAFGSHTGIRSKRARIEGDADLSHIIAHRVPRTTSRASSSTPRFPKSRCASRPERLVLDFEGGEIVGADDRPRVHDHAARAQDLTFAGRGLDVRLLEERARLLHDVHIEGVPPARAGSKRVPFTLDAPGPVELEFQKRQGKGARALARRHARVDPGEARSVRAGRSPRDGDGRDADDERTLRGREARSRRRRADLGSGSDARGTRLFVTPQHASVLARLEGDPVVIRPMPESAALRAGAARDDATLTTQGAITISPVQAGPDGVRGRTTGSVRESLFDGDRGSRRSRERRRCGRAADPNAEVAFRVASRSSTRTTPRPIRGRGESVIVRKGAAPRRSTTSRSRGPTTSSTARSAAARRPRRPGPRRAGGPGLRRRPHPHEGHRGASRSRTRSPPTGRSRSRLREASGRSPRSARTPRPPRAERSRPRPRASSSRRSRAAVLPGGGAFARGSRASSPSGRVRVDLPGRARARGDRITYDGALRGSCCSAAATDEARARRARHRADRRTGSAPQSITFHQDTLRFVATQGVNAEIALAPLPWIGIPSRANAPPVPSRLCAQRLVAIARRRALSQRARSSPTEVTAEINVRLTQRDRMLTADYASLDPLRQTGTGARISAPLRREPDRRRSRAAPRARLPIAHPRRRPDRSSKDPPRPSCTRSAASAFPARRQEEAGGVPAPPPSRRAGAPALRPPRRRLEEVIRGRGARVDGAGRSASRRHDRGRRLGAPLPRGEAAAPRAARSRATSGSSS